MIPATGSCRKDAGKSPYPAGKMRESHRILQESTGNRWNMEAVFRPENFRFFFRWIPTNFLCFPEGTSRKSSEKIRKFSGGNTASKTLPELPGTDRFRAGLFDLVIFSCYIFKSERKIEAPKRFLPDIFLDLT
jgi:hypothetical protein